MTQSSNVPERKAPGGALPAISAGSGAPGWLLPLYLGGLALVLIGERALAGLPKGAGAVSAFGVLAMVVVTALRFSPKFKGQGERAGIERLLALLSLLSLVALAVYYVTTDSGAERFGISSLSTDKRDHAIELLRVVWISLLTLSVVPQVFAETALRPMRRAERPEARRVKAAALAGGALAMVVVYGSLLVYASGGIKKRWDYSYFKTSRPGESTLKIAKSLNDPVRVVAFFPDVNEVRSEVEGYLKELAASSPKLKVEVRDRLLSPKLAKELRANQDGVVILSKGSATYTLNIGTDMEAARPKLLTLDRDFQEQLLKAAQAHKSVYFTVGHGEINDVAKGAEKNDNGRVATIAKLLLQKQNVTVKDLGLGQGLGNDVPADADAVVVLGPSEAFSPEEIASLTRFADRGGHMLLALDPESASSLNLVGSEESAEAAAENEAPPTAAAPSAASAKAPPVGSAKPAAPPAAPKTPAPPHLAALAGVVGLTYLPDLLSNETQHIRFRNNDSDRTRISTSSFSSHASVSTLSRNSPRAAIVVLGSGALEKPQSMTGKVDFTVRSPSNTWGDANKNYRLDKDSEKSAVYNIAAAVTRPVAGAAEPAKVDEKDKGKKPEPKEMRAFVSADVDVFSDVAMSNVIGNQLLFVDAMRWLVGEESFMGQTNSEEDVRIEHTKQQDLAWFYSTIFGIPAAVLGVGLLARRRMLSGGGK